MVKYVTHTQNILSSYCRVYQATHTHTHTQRCKVQGSESKSPAMCLFHAWTSDSLISSLSLLAKKTAN